MIGYDICSIYLQTVTFNGISVEEVILTNILRALLALIMLVLYHKTIDVFITLFS